VLEPGQGRPFTSRFRTEYQVIQPVLLRKSGQL
jgi:hypothetical protein